MTEHNIREARVGYIAETPGVGISIVLGDGEHDYERWVIPASLNLKLAIESFAIVSRYANGGVLARVDASLAAQLARSIQLNAELRKRIAELESA